MSDVKDSINWLHSTSGRSKRSTITTSGCFVLEHVATGRFYVEASKCVSKTVDERLALLKAEKHPCKLLNGLYSRDPDIRVHEYPIKSDSKCKALMEQLEAAAVNDYLCLNTLIKKKRKRK